MTDACENDFHRIVLEALPVGVYVVNRERKVILWSSGAEKFTGYLQQDVLGRLREADLVEQCEQDKSPAENASEGPKEELQQGLASATQVSVRCKNGHYLSVHLRSVPLRDEAGRFLGTARVFEGNSPARLRNRRQEKLGAYGCLDPLTGVLNHSMIQARMKESLNLHALYPVPFCVICYTVDDLIKLGERYGHAAVDAAQRVVANTFETGLRPTDFLGRWMDQEFLAILPECGDGDVLKVGERLRKLVQHAGVEWWGDTLHATVSIGVTCVHDNDSVSSLVGRAEQGMRESSSNGGNRVLAISA